MAGFLAVRDPDPDRRLRAVTDAQRLLADRGLPAVGDVTVGDVAVVYATGHGAPLDAVDGVVLVGDAIEGSRRLDARGWRATWSGDGTPPPTDGLHLGIAVDADGTLTVDVDLFGLLPVLHTTAGDALLVASSPALLRCHPSFRPAIDRAALAALLLTDALVDGDTALRGVRRLPPGHVLRAAPGRAVEERAAWAMPITDALHDVAPQRRLADLFHEALLDACRRHLPGGRTAMLLSGGLDSRLLIGTLQLAGIDVDAVTFGTSRDTEARYAGNVARSLGLPHRLIAPESVSAPLPATITWEGLVATPSFDHPLVGRSFDRVVSGFLMDATAGASHIDWQYDVVAQQSGFEPFFGKLNQHAVREASLRAVLRPEAFGDGVDEAKARVRAVWDAAGDSDAERAWRYDLAHRQRYWVGVQVPRQSSDAWPVLPHLDREVLALVGGMPVASVASRALEIEVCKAHHPVLARLRLEKTTFESSALIPRTGDMVRTAVARKVRAARALARVPITEPRYFTRIFDIEGEAWQRARAGLEHARPLAHELFDPPTFDRILPPVGAPWNGPSSYPGSNGAKLLLGVMAMLADGIEP
jgi:asparagine synthase (glutamine-hydrolysing)